MESVENKIYCNDSGEDKMLFETRGGAKRFIEKSTGLRYYSDYSPMVSYFCKSCNGWHVKNKEKPQTETSIIGKFLDLFSGIWRKRLIEKEKEITKKQREKAHEKRISTRLDTAYNKIGSQISRLEIIMAKVNLYSESLFTIQNYLEHLTEAGISGKKLQDVHIILDELSEDINLIGQRKIVKTEKNEEAG